MCRVRFTTATVPANAIVTPRTASITAMNPTPGGGTSSPALTFTVQNPLAATPVISPPAGSYGYGINISMTEPSSTPGATIYYTTDGTTPTSASRKYSSPFLIDGSATMQAISVTPNFTNSAIASSAYVVAGSPTVLDLPAISVTASAGTVRSLISGHNLAGQVWFIYGTSPSALTTNTPQQALAASASAVIFQAPLTGLLGGTTYYFQAVTTTPGRTSSGAILSVTTP
ncbi:MAG TPA: chitobiase/beta-hexosaminidase C-terminal domain-containing protein [Terracidiphilus sp.]|nr:chitobiase/beta-hexosaminidase C-terminal domain-containing protein [Terracidiphilus sp.]